MSGLIETDWKKEDKTFVLKVSIPANTRAEIWVPAAINSVITENNKPVQEVTEIKLIRHEKGFAIFSVGCGEYHFRSDYK